MDGICQPEEDFGSFHRAICTGECFLQGFQQQWLECFFYIIERVEKGVHRLQEVVVCHSKYFLLVLLSSNGQLCKMCFRIVALLQST